MLNITIDALTKAPAFAGILRELETAQLAERQSQIDALEKHRNAWRQEAARINAEARAAKERLEELRMQALAAAQDFDRANSACCWGATKATRVERELEAAILAGADPRLAKFRAWASRAANLAAVATYETAAAFAGAPPASNTRQAREVARLCAEATARADQMRREAVTADNVSLELDAMAAGILQALDRAGGSGPGRLPRDWQAPLI